MQVNNITMTLRSMHVPTSIFLHTSDVQRQEDEYYIWFIFTLFFLFSLLHAGHENDS